MLRKISYSVSHLLDNSLCHIEPYFKYESSSLTDQDHLKSLSILQLFRAHVLRLFYTLILFKYDAFK
jgi:hypothetical protein